MSITVQARALTTLCQVLYGWFCFVCIRLLFRIHSPLPLFHSADRCGGLIWNLTFLPSSGLCSRKALLPRWMIRQFDIAAVREHPHLISSQSGIMQHMESLPIFHIITYHIDSEKSINSCEIFTIFIKMSVGLFLPCFSNQAPNKHRRYGFSPPLPRWAALVCTQHNLHYVIFFDHSQEHSSGMLNLERAKPALSASFKTSKVQRVIFAAIFWKMRLRCRIKTSFSSTQ